MSGANYYHCPVCEKKALYDRLVDTYLAAVKPVAEQLVRAREQLIRHGHDPVECGCELSAEDASAASSPSGTEANRA